MTESLKKGIMFLLALIQLAAKAQTFAWKSKLDSVPAPGFYTIPLSIDWLVHAKTDLSDIRIKDEHNNTVPFLVKKLPGESHASFIEFPILKNTTDSNYTRLDIDAAGHHGTDHLWLVISNNAVQRFSSLSGSDDQKQWFIIDEKLLLNNNRESINGHFMQELNLPFIRYRFLRLSINNKRNYPLQILKAGIYADTSVKESPELHPQYGTSFVQKDRVNGYTYVYVHNQQAYPVDRISIALSGSKFYNREIKAYSLSGAKAKTLLGISQLRSGEDPAIWVTAGKAQDLLVVIENGDNPPLKITAVNTQCRTKSLIAYFEKGRAYTLFGGNDSLASPQYDLALFRDSIPSQSPFLKHQQIVANNQLSKATAAKKSWWIWAAILVSLLVLTVLTFRLMRDMKKAKL